MERQGGGGEEAGDGERKDTRGGDTRQRRHERWGQGWEEDSGDGIRKGRGLPKKWSED